ncbi:MAG TPA: hypothetical protein VEB20_25135 [Azospirillaceae bacterium]|nr:hypothetical protein [Azospirillaceae bacterium]
MSKYEERVYRSPGPRSPGPSVASQLARLKSDLAQYMQRNPTGPMIGPLRERIKELEAAASSEVKRSRRADDINADEAADGRDNVRGAGTAAPSGRFPPRFRPGQ